MLLLLLLLFLQFFLFYFTLPSSLRGIKRRKKGKEKRRKKLKLGNNVISRRKGGSLNRGTSYVISDQFFSFRPSTARFSSLCKRMEDGVESD